MHVCRLPRRNLFLRRRVVVVNLGLWTNNIYCLRPKYKVSIFCHSKMSETSLCSFLCQRQLYKTDWMSKRVSQVSLILPRHGHCRSIQLTTGSTATLSQGHSQGQVILRWILSFVKNRTCKQGKNCFLCILLSPSWMFYLLKQNAELFPQPLLPLWMVSPWCDSQNETTFFVS